MKNKGRATSITAYVRYVRDTYDQYPMRGKIPNGTQDKNPVPLETLDPPPRCPPNPLLLKFD
jgi:hypothetical protein